eukprot:6436781-Amphidinium_carterae.1
MIAEVNLESSTYADITPLGSTIASMHLRPVLEDLNNDMTRSRLNEACRHSTASVIEGDSNKNKDSATFAMLCKDIPHKFEAGTPAFAEVCCGRILVEVEDKD